MWNSAVVPTTPPKEGHLYQPAHRQAELEALKERGLAKLLNKHFTETTQRLAAEKAAADAALADLEARKASTSTFVVSGDGELSPLDAMYVRVNQWRNECRRKERETILLYQRYVNKFGSTGHIQVPMATPLPPMNCGAPRAPVTPESIDLPPREEAIKVPGLAADIEHRLEEHAKQGGVVMPSVELLGKEETFQSYFAKEEADFRNYYRRQLEAKGVDAKATEINVLEDTFEFLQLNGADAASVVSGLTSVNSAVTRRILQDCEKTVVDFLQDERQAIREMMEESSNHDETQHDEIGSIQREAVCQAESMAEKMQNILQDFEKRKDPDSPKKGRPYSTSNPNESWMVYYDETYQRDYYHETISNRTQWYPPETMDNTSESSHTETTAVNHAEVKPEIPFVSRRLRYRQQQKRRQKRRRRAAAALVVLTVVTLVAYVCSPTLQAWTEEQFNSITGRDVLLREEKEEAARQAQVQAQAQARALEIKRLALQRAEEERSRLARLEELRRPWGCNIPLAHAVHGRCHRLSTENPPFDLHALVSSMMQ